MKDIVNDFLNGSIQLKITSDSEWGQVRQLLMWCDIEISDGISIGDSGTYISVSKKQNLKVHKTPYQTETIPAHEFIDYFKNQLMGHQKRYYEMTEQERNRNYLVSALDIVVGGKPDILLELVSILEKNKDDLGLTLKHVLNELKNELDM